MTASDVMSVRYETSAAPTASPAPRPTAVAAIQREADAAVAEQRPLRGADPGAGDDAVEDGGRHRVDASGDEVRDEAGRAGRRGR